MGNVTSATGLNAGSSKRLYLYVLVAVLIGILLGEFAPDLAKQMKPFGDGFVKLVKMVIAPIIFATVVVGIAKLTDAREVGRVGLVAILYFEALTTAAMVIGLAVGLIVRPGGGAHIDAASLDPKGVSQYVNAPHLTVPEFLLNIIPDTIVGAFAKGDILPVLFFAVLFGIALSSMGARGRAVVQVLDEAGAALFRVIGIIMRVAPLGAFGAIAFFTASFGAGSLVSLLWLMGCFYVTCLLFVFLVLGGVCAVVGLNLLSVLAYIKDEFFIVLGTSSSEAALPTLMEKMERLGCGKSLVGLTVPLGYAFNLDGSSIYFTMAITFIAQALGIELSLGEYAEILAILLLTSKGAAAVTGGGFITLAATLATLGGKVPVTGMVLILGIDRFMSEARAIVNLIGNTVATIFVAWWDGRLDVARARAVLSGADVSDPEPLTVAAE